MGIVFFCQSCGARFEVPAQMAGKKGRCKKCGQYMPIPKSEHLASMAAMPALAPGGGGGAAAALAVPKAASISLGGRGRGASPGKKSMGDWLDMSMSKIGLAPLSMQNIPRKPFAPSALDDAEDSKPYVLERPERLEAYARGGRPANFAVAAWRKEMGLISKIFRWLNQFAYIVSVPFIIILLFGIAVKTNSIAVFGATFVVLLNIGRIAAGVANLAVIPLRDGFDFRKYKKPLRRVIEPVVTIALVVLAFTFIPWLSSGKASTGTITERIRSSAESLKKEITGEVGRVTDKAKDLNLDKLGKDALDKAKNIDLNKLGSQAQEKFKGLGGSSSEGSEKAAPGDAGAPPQKGASLRESIKQLKQGSELLKDLQKEP